MQRRTLIAVVAVALAAGITGLALRSGPAATTPASIAATKGTEQKMVRTAKGAPVVTATTKAKDLSIDDVIAAGEDVGTDRTDLLVIALDSEEAVVVAEAANALVSRKAIAALPALMDQDIPSRPWAAPSVIDAMGRLAAEAPLQQRADVVDHLVKLLEVEKRRESIEALGNTIQIYEALGQTGEAKAIAALERELVDPTVETAPKVVIVQSLVALKAVQSKELLARVQAEVAALPPTDGLEAELRKDLLNVLGEALVALS